MIKAGFITAGVGIACFGIGGLMGFGPCGPASPAGYVFFIGGMGAIFGGSIVGSIGLILATVRHFRGGQ